MDKDLIEDLKLKKELFWINPKEEEFSSAIGKIPVSLSDVKDAQARLERFIPYIKSAFPENPTGYIESHIDPIPNMKALIEDEFKLNIGGQVFLKRDDLLPIAGSIKARGGIYEVLKHAEALALENGLLKETDDYSLLNSPEFKKFFSTYKIQVGSTGNLGLSIGIMSAKIGFNVIVHMSSDAKEWKKDLLRSKGVRVIEYDSDYSIAVLEGRKLSDSDPKSYFIDDENSKDLFLGYAVGGYRTGQQIDQLNIKVDGENPLYVYLPCGVGGGPGGVAFGLKLYFGDRVKCIFAEPTNSPAMLLGLYTGLHDKISVFDIGLTNLTEADGLAVGRPSSFVGNIMDKFLTGAFTIEDHRLFGFLKGLYESENIFIEPSACAGFMGPVFVERDSRLKKGNHLIWATGGSLVPSDIKDRLLK